MCTDGTNTANITSGKSIIISLPCVMMMSDGKDLFMKLVIYNSID